MRQNSMIGYNSVDHIILITTHPFDKLPLDHFPFPNVDPGMVDLVPAVALGTSCVLPKNEIAGL